MSASTARPPEAAPALVVVGASLGGLRALGVVLGALPRDFPLPLVAVQHRGREEGGALARVLQAGAALPVGEPDDREPLAAGRVHVAPADYHLLVEAGSLRLSTDAPVNCSRPSIDVLFESAADAYGAGVIAVILTGASADGAAGAARVKARGGRLLVQDPADAEAPAMPAAALAAARADHVAPLAGIAPLLQRLCGPGGEGTRHE